MRVVKILSLIAVFATLFSSCGNSTDDSEKSNKNNNHQLVFQTTHCHPPQNLKYKNGLYESPARNTSDSSNNTATIAHSQYPFLKRTESFAFTTFPSCVEQTAATAKRSKVLHRIYVVSLLQKDTPTPNILLK